LTEPMRLREIVSWLAGAALYLFIFGLISAVVGPNAIVSVLWVGIALAVLARQYRRHRRRRVTFTDPD